MISKNVSRMLSQLKYLFPVFIIAGFLAFSTNIFGLKASILYIQPTVKLSVANIVQPNFSYHSLGGVVNGTTVPATVTLENEGSSPLVVSSVAMTSAPGQYSITGLPTLPFTITTSPVTFQVTSIATLPVNTASYLNVGSLDVLSNDPLSPLFEVKFITNITNTPEPEIDVTVNGVSNMFTQTFDFGNINLNAVVSADINISNASPVTYPDLKILATPTLSTSDFSLGGSIPTPGMQIAPSSSTSAMQVFVDTSSIGQKTGTLEISSDDTDEAIYRIPFTARVVGTPLINFSPNQYTITENGMNITGQVILSGPVTSNTIINFVSSNTGSLDTPASITITSGSSNGYFILSAPIDTNSINETVNVTASATGFISGTSTVYVTDNTQQNITFTPNTYSVIEQAANPTNITVSIPSIASSNVTLNLTNSNNISLSIPAIAIITAGNTSTTFPVSALDEANTINETITITASATGYTPGTATVNITDNDAPMLTFNPNIYGVTEQAANSTTVTLNVSPTPINNLVVTLTNSNSLAILSPATVTIVGGTPSITFPISAPSDANTINENLTITGSATGYTSDTATINVTDDDAPTFTFIPNTYTVVEQATTATTVTLNVSPAPINNLVITLTNSNNTALTTPTTVTIIGGTPSITFPISALDDANIINETSTITASATGYNNGTANINITDNDTLVTPAFTFTPSTYTVIEQATTATTVTLNVSQAPISNLVVTLTNSNNLAISSPATVTIIAGTPSVTFPISGLNDANTVNETVNITASATGYTSSIATLTVLDNDAPAALTFVPSTYTITELGASTTLTIFTNLTPTSNTNIVLTSSNIPSLTVPTSVTLNSGSNFTSFQVSAPDDGNTVNETVTVSASATGYTASTATVAVTDIGNSIPSVTSALPNNNDTNIGLNANVIVTFSEPVVLNFPTDYSLTGKVRFFKNSAPTVLIPATVTYTPANSMIVINPTNNLDPSVPYTFFISNTIQDVTNNNLSNSVQNIFTTGTTVDSTPPTIVSISPVNNATNVPVPANTTQVFITFSEPVVLFNTSYSANGPISVMKNNILVPGSGVYQSTNSTYRVTFASNLSFNSLYTIGIANTVTDIVGNVLAANTSSSFTTESLRPFVTGIYPSNAQNNVPTATPIIINFSEDVTPGSIQVTLTNTTLNTAVTLSAGTYSNTSGIYTFSIPSVTLLPTTPYRITVASGLQSVSTGNTMGSTYSSTFTTSTSSSLIPDVKIIPATGDVLCVQSAAMISFDMPMNATSFTPITIQEINQFGGTVLSTLPFQGTYTSMIGNRSFYMMTPTNGFIQNKFYRITVPQTVQSITGSTPTQAKISEFSTSNNGVCNNTNPSITVNPVTGTTNFPVAGTLSLSTVNNPFNPMTLTTQNLKAYSLINYSSVPYNIQWSSDMKTITLIPNQLFVINTDYAIEVSSTLQNTRGENIPHTLSYFSTGDYLDLPGAPYVIQLVKNSSGEIRYHSPIEFWFNESVNPTTVTILNVVLKDNGGSPVAGTIQQISSNKYRFIPSADLRKSSQYSLNINTNVLDRSNNRLDQISSTTVLDPYSEDFFTTRGGGSADNNGGGNGSGGSNGGGQVLGASDVMNPIKGLSSSLNVDCAILDASLAVSTFPDITSENQWPAKYIGALYKCGAFKGNEAGKAEMWRLTSRAELTKIALIINNIEIETGLSMPFPDVPRSSWQYDVIATAYKYNIIKGYADGTFGPNKTINRNESLKITLEAAGFDAAKYTPTTYFTDTDRAHWSSPYQSFAKENDISKGYDDGSFKPNNPINRSESAKMFVETAQLIKEWFPPK